MPTNFERSEPVERSSSFQRKHLEEQDASSNRGSESYELSSDIRDRQVEAIRVSGQPCFGFFYYETITCKAFAGRVGAVSMRLCSIRIKNLRSFYGSKTEQVLLALFNFAPAARYTAKTNFTCSFK